MAYKAREPLLERNDVTGLAGVERQIVPPSFHGGAWATENTSRRRHRHLAGTASITRTRRRLIGQCVSGLLRHVATLRRKHRRPEPEGQE